MFSGTVQTDRGYYAIRCVYILNKDSSVLFDCRLCQPTLRSAQNKCARAAGRPEPPGRAKGPHHQNDEAPPEIPTAERSAELSRRPDLRSACLKPEIEARRRRPSRSVPPVPRHGVAVPELPPSLASLADDLSHLNAGPPVTPATSPLEIPEIKGLTAAVPVPIPMSGRRLGSQEDQ